MNEGSFDEEKDKIFEKLSAEEHKRQADKEYWENVRNELYIDIAIQPVKAIEFIYIPLRIKNTGEDLTS